MLAFSAFSAFSALSFGFTDQRLEGLPLAPVFTVISRNQPYFSRLSRRLSVCSMSRLWRRASRRISRTETSERRFALIHRSTRRALTWRSVKPICRRQARVCGQKYSWTSRMAASINCASIFVGSGPPRMAQSKKQSVPASLSVWACPLAIQSRSRPSGLASGHAEIAENAQNVLSPLAIAGRRAARNRHLDLVRLPCRQCA